MSQYSDIIKRLEAATGQDRESDIMIGLVIDYEMESLSLRNTVEVGGMERMLEKAERYNNIWKGLPRWTASLDAATALVERMLPGSEWAVGREDDERYGGGVRRFGDEHLAEGRLSPSIAILTAMFRALEAQEDAA